MESKTDERNDGAPKDYIGELKLRYPKQENNPLSEMQNSLMESYS